MTRTDLTEVQESSFAREDTLLLIDFKWLMAGQGWWLDMAAWGSDRAYTAQLLQCALQSDNATLRATATLVLRRGLALVNCASSAELARR
jgi:hypothetical protein